MKSFNLRVYGVLIQNAEVLITHEHRAGIQMTKFPGGGLEWGEGLADCLIREFHEELELDIEVGELIYTNEFLQISAFSRDHQLHSFYYRVTSTNWINKKFLGSPTGLKSGEQAFEWINIAELNPSAFTFPIDKIVAEKLKST